MPILKNEDLDSLTVVMCYYMIM